MARLRLLAVSSLLVVATVAAVASAQVQCGTLGSLPISGCLTCEEVTVNTTFGYNGSGRGFQGNWSGYGADGVHTWAIASAGRGGPKGFGAEVVASAGRHRKLLHGRHGAFYQYGGIFGSFARGPKANCTECDASANFVLATGHGGHWHSTWGAGRCVCADGFGATSAATDNVTVSNATLTFDQFTCVKCTDGEVPLGHKSGLIPAYNSTTQAWTLVLNTTVTGRRATRLAMRLQANSIRTGSALKTSFAGATFMLAGLASLGLHAEPATKAPWTPGQCVACPDVSTTSDGVTCVAP